MAYGITQSLDLEKSSSQFAYIGDASITGIDFTDDFTLECWIKLESLPSGGSNFSIVAKDDEASQRQYNWIIDQSTKKMAILWWGTGASIVRFNSDYVFVTGDLDTWIHVAVTVDVGGKNALFYKDGVATGSTFDTGTATTLQNTTANFTVGVAGSTYFDGKISLLRAWSVVRTSGEILANMCNVLGSTTNLGGEWKFDNAYTDNSGNGNTLTPANSPTFSVDTPSVCASSVSVSNFLAMF